MLRGVTERAERLHDIGFGLPFLCFQLIAEILIDLGGTCAVEEHKDFELPFHALCLVIVIPSEVENGAAGEAATSTGRPKAERTGSERIKSLIVVSLAIPEMSRLRSICRITADYFVRLNLPVKR